MNNILTILKTISKINPGDKLRVKGKNLDIDYRWFQFIVRFWDKEGKDATITQLREIYRTTCNVVYELIDFIHGNKHHANTAVFRNKCRRLKNVADELGRSYTGIRNLMITYDDCPNVISELEVIIDTYIKSMHTEITRVLISINSEFIPITFNFDNDIILEVKKNELSKSDDFSD